MSPSLYVQTREAVRCHASKAVKPFSKVCFFGGRCFHPIITYVLLITINNFRADLTDVSVNNSCTGLFIGQPATGVPGAVPYDLCKY